MAQVAKSSSSSSVSRPAIRASKASLDLSRRLAPHPLEHLAPMLLPVLRQIEQKALVERSTRGLGGAARVSVVMTTWFGDCVGSPVFARP
jgi:hypothetical protein